MKVRSEKVATPLLTITVAVLGCTTNRTPGNGQPVTPSASPANTYGSSSGNVPMTSSYSSPLAAAGYNFRRLLAWLRFLLLSILIALGLTAQLKST